MKKLATTLSLMVFMMTALFAQEKVQSIEKTGGAEMDFESEVIDYGTIPQNADGVRTFKFTNTGNEPLIISNAKGSCGCTVPQWPREEIAPGETGEIKVRYDTKRIGMINKTVTIQSNAMNADDITKNRKDAEGKTIGGTSMIRIKGEVKRPAENATPIKPAAGPMNNSKEG